MPLYWLPPQQSNLSRHRTWRFRHSCSYACCPGRVSSAAKQKADNAGDNEIGNRANHHAAHSAEQHEDVGLTKQHPDHQSADEGTKDAGDREAPGKPDVTSLTHVCCV